MPIVVAVLLMLSGGSAQAAPAGTIESIPIPETEEPGPNGITAGPEGLIWFTEFGQERHGLPCPKPCASKIGVINPTTHEIHQYETHTPEAGPFEITAGPDGNLWFTEFNVGKIGVINPTTHEIKEFDIPVTNNEKPHPFGIAAGREGDLWFTAPQFTLGSQTEQTYVGEINAETHHISPPIKTPTAHSFPAGIATGPEGNLWFAEGEAAKIGMVNPSTDSILEFPTTGSGPALPGEITLGPEGNMWFSELSGAIGEINPKTQEIKEYSTMGPTPLGITSGREGGIWVTEIFANDVVKFSPATTKFAQPFEVPGGGPTGITAGKEGNLWFSEHQAGAIGTIAPAGPAICGNANVGEAADSFLAERKRVNRCELPVGAEVSELTVYLSPGGASGQQLITGVLYEDSHGAPGSLLRETEPLTFKSTNAAGWYHLHFATPLKVKPGSYWIGELTGPTSHVAGFRYNSVAGARDYNVNAYASGPSNPFGPFTQDSEQMSLYATYTPTEQHCGNARVGEAGDSFLAERKRVNRCELPVKAEVNELTVYLSPGGPTGQQSITGVFYGQDSHGAPGSLLGETEPLTFKSTDAAGWYHLHFATPLIVPPGNYWIGELTGPTSHVAGFRYNSVAGARDYNVNAYVSGPSDPFGPFTQDSEQMSLYATYTEH